MRTQSAGLSPRTVWERWYPILGLAWIHGLGGLAEGELRDSATFPPVNMRVSILHQTHLTAALVEQMCSSSSTHTDLIKQVVLELTFGSEVDAKYFKISHNY